MVHVTFLVAYDKYAVGDEADLDQAVADKLVAAGICEVTEGEVETEAADEELCKALESKIVARITKTLNKNVRIPAVAKDETKSLAEWLSLVGKSRNSNDSRVREKAMNTLTNKYKVWGDTAMDEGTNADGGYTVPVEYVSDLLFVPGYEGTVFPTRIQARPMGSKSLVLPALDQTVSPSAGSSAFYAGVSLGIVSEGSAPADNTQPKFLQVVLTAKKLLATATISNELIDDSMIALESVLKDQFTRATTAWVNYELFNGGGGGTALTGVIDHAATIKVSRNTADDIKLVDLATMYASLAPDCVKNACWFVNPIAISKFIPMGGSTSGSYFTWIDGAAQNAPPARLFGLPIITSECLPTIGGAGDVVLADFRYYALGIRKEISLDVSPHYLFPSDQTVYRLKMRLDGKPQLTAPIYLQNGTDTVSPFVQLDDTVAS